MEEGSSDILTEEHRKKAYEDLGILMVMWCAKKGLFLSTIDFAREKADIAKHTNLSEARLVELYAFLSNETQAMGFNKPGRHVIKGLGQRS